MPPVTPIKDNGYKIVPPYCTSKEAVISGETVSFQGWKIGTYTGQIQKVNEETWFEFYQRPSFHREGAKFWASEQRIFKLEKPIGIDPPTLSRHFRF